MSYSFYTTNDFNYDFGLFVDRPNRFIAHVQFQGKVLRCHVPDPGRMKELLTAGVKVLLRFPINPSQYKTEAALIGVFLSDKNIWVSIDSQLATRYIKHQWTELPFFKNFDYIRPEFSFGESRLDFLLQKKGLLDCLVEVKTVTLVEKNIGLFPDAPTKRGTKHVYELIKAVEQGYNAAVVFFVPRNDAIIVKPNKHLDKDFYLAVKKAMESKVEFVVLRYIFEPEGIIFDQEIPFSLE